MSNACHKALRPVAAAARPTWPAGLHQPSAWAAHSKSQTYAPARHAANDSIIQVHGTVGGRHHQHTVAGLGAQAVPVRHELQGQAVGAVGQAVGADVGQEKKVNVWRQRVSTQGRRLSQCVMSCRGGQSNSRLDNGEAHCAMKRALHQALTLRRVTSSAKQSISCRLPPPHSSSCAVPRAHWSFGRACLSGGGGHHG